jgi:hypothetical protein
LYLYETLPIVYDCTVEYTFFYCISYCFCQKFAQVSMLIGQATLIFWFIVQEQFWEAFSCTWDTGNLMYVERSSTAGLRVCRVADSVYKRKVEGV